MARLTERKLIMLSKVELAGLARLAEINSSGNESELLRRLLRDAIHNPEKFGLLPERETGRAT